MFTAVHSRARVLTCSVSRTYLLWVEHPDDLCDGSLVKSWNHVTAGGEELQLECLGIKDGSLWDAGRAL